MIVELQKLQKDSLGPLLIAALTCKRFLALHGCADMCAALDTMLPSNLY
jgi:hypothetical protein